MELYPYPRFCLKDRDRRWKAVREEMARHKLDVIVTPNNTGHSTDFQANTRYLIHCGGGGDVDIAAVFPLEGDVTAIATSAALRRHYGMVVVERLKELGVGKGRIGITGLGKVAGTRTPGRNNSLRLLEASARSLSWCRID